MKTKKIKTFSAALGFILSIIASLSFSNENVADEFLLDGYAQTSSDCVSVGLMECVLLGNETCTKVIEGNIYLLKNNTACVTKLWRGGL